MTFYRLPFITSNLQEAFSPIPRNHNPVVGNGEYVTPSVIREMYEETGLTIENPRLCDIKEFQKSKDGKRYIVFLYIANKFSGEIKSFNEGEIFWYPLSELFNSNELIDGFREMLLVFINECICEIYYERIENENQTIYC